MVIRILCSRKLSLAKIRIIWTTCILFCCSVTLWWIEYNNETSAKQPQNLRHLSFRESNHEGFEVHYGQNLTVTTNRNNLNLNIGHRRTTRADTSSTWFINGASKFLMRSADKRTKFSDPYGASWAIEKCLKRDYSSIVTWPRASVVITFCDNEQLADLLHTVHSVIQRTPTSLIAQIILIDDNTTKDDFKNPLLNYCRAVFGDKVQVHRSGKTLGLIKARLWGSRLATGDVIVVLDAHMEVQEKWLEPILSEIIRDKKIMATISMDWMEPRADGLEGWKYSHGPGSFLCYYNWDLVFGYTWPNNKWSQIYANDSSTPLPSPCSVGNWAMDRSFFISIGELDEGMDMWGGENLELAIRTWLFGGRTVQIPCSHAAHLERPHQRDYRSGWDIYLHRNYKRVVEVWFDEYKKYFYMAFPQLKDLDMGDISERLKLKSRAQHNFTWYIENVYPALGVYDVNSLAYGKVRNLYHRGCMQEVGVHTSVTMTTCGDLNNMIYLSDDLLLRSGAFIMLADALTTDAGLSYNEALAQLDKPHLTRWIHWKSHIRSRSVATFSGDMGNDVRDDFGIWGLWEDSLDNDGPQLQTRHTPILLFEHFEVCRGVGIPESLNTLQPTSNSWFNSNGPLKILGLNLCMEFDEKKNSVLMKKCDPCKLQQRWRWEKYTKTYYTISNNKTNRTFEWAEKAVIETNTLKKIWKDPRPQTFGRIGDQIDQLLLC